MPKRKKKEPVEQINYATVAKPHTSMYLFPNIYKVIQKKKRLF